MDIFLRRELRNRVFWLQRQNIQGKKHILEITLQEYEL